MFYKIKYFFFPVFFGLQLLQVDSSEAYKNLSYKDRDGPIKLLKTSKITEGKILFQLHCNSCHSNGSNSIFPEKNLKKENLKANGLISSNDIRYQIRNGKNGMPAFGGRLSESAIYEISDYIFTTF